MINRGGGLDRETWQYSEHDMSFHLFSHKMAGPRLGAATGVYEIHSGPSRSYAEWLEGWHETCYVHNQPASFHCWLLYTWRWKK